LINFGRYSKAAQADQVVHNLGKYIIEASMMDLKLYRYLPSEIAAAAIYIARAMTEQTPWTPTLTHYTGYRFFLDSLSSYKSSETEIRPVALAVNLLVKKLARSPYKAMLKKYSSPKLSEVALFPMVDL